MSRSVGYRQRGTLFSILMVAAIAFEGCGGGSASAGVAASASENPTPSAAASTPSPSPKPSPTPSSTPSPSLAIDPSADLTIASPYGLAELDAVTAAEVEAGLQTALGSMASAINVGVRTVTKDGAQVGLAMVIDFPGSTLLTVPGFIDSMAGGVAGAGGTITKATILGRPVRMITANGGSYALFLRGKSAIFAIAQTPTAAKAIVTALLKTNK